MLSKKFLLKIHTLLYGWGNKKKKSVELTLVYQNGGCGKTLTKINDTMPHTWIVWVHAQKVHNYT